MQKNYAELEQEIVEFLQPLLGGNVDVVQLPQTQAEYERVLNRTRVTVAYQMSEFGDIKDTGIVIQEENPHFEIIVEAMQLRGEDKLHDVINKVKSSLLGFTPTDCQKLHLSKQAFSKFDNASAVWGYSMMWKTTTLLVENVPDETGINLTEVTFDETFTG